ncbi:MAG TPA: hypothetical protein V6C78_28625, partial [Crinalium sp.]
ARSAALKKTTVVYSRENRCKSDERAFREVARRATPLKARFCVRVAHAKLGYRIHVILSVD